jgi:hypothetical protein
MTGWKLTPFGNSSLNRLKSPFFDELSSSFFAISLSFDIYTLAMPGPVHPPVSAMVFWPEEGMFGTVIVVYAILIEALDRPLPLFDPVRFQPPHSSAPHACPTPIVEEHMPGLQLDNLVVTQGPYGDPLRCPLELWFGASATDAPFNEAIFSFACKMPSRSWYGPVLVLKYNGRDRGGYVDAGETDLHTLHAFFCA